MKASRFIRALGITISSGSPSLTKQSNAVRRVTQAEFEEILSSVKQRYRFLFALLAGTGLRIGETLGLKTSDLSDCCILHERRSVWHGKEQEPKTSNAIRTIDIPKVLARVLRAYVAGSSGYLFATANGRPLLARNVLRVLHDTGKRGVPCFSQIPCGSPSQEASARRPHRVVVGTLSDLNRPLRHAAP